MNRRQVVQLPEPGDIGRMVVRGATQFARRNKVITGGYLLGLLTLIFVGSGFQLTRQQKLEYNRIMDTIDLHAEYDASDRYWKARHAYQATKGWFFSCDSLCQRNKARMEEAERALNYIREEGNARMSDAKAIAGITSEVGVGEIKDSFWQYFTAGKDFAKRQSMWDVMFTFMRTMWQRRRDESTIDVVVRILMQVLFNFSIGLTMALIMFVIGLWSIVQSYQPNPIVAVLVFVASSCAAFTFVVSFLFAIYGTAAGGVYGLAKLAESQARLQNGGARQNVYNRPHYD